MDLFGAVSSDDMRAAQMVTAATMAGFLAAGLVPGLQRYAARIRLVLLAAYLLACGGFIAYVLLR